jgi:hypothetical protein
MGRIRKYETEAEKAEAKRLRAQKYYWDNKDECDKKQRRRDKKKREGLQ